MGQQITCEEHVRGRLEEILRERGIRTLFLVCGRSFDRLAIRAEIESLPARLVRFSDFSPNPRYEDVCKAVRLFRAERCDGILAVGGGSAIDVAKCVKLFCRTDPDKNYLDEPPADTAVPLIAVPTTAGTGSESTHFAVLYYQGAKRSVAHESILPDHAVLAPSVLEGLPAYQRKCTMLDALCQAIESWWSIRSTPESVDYSRRAIETIMAARVGYIEEYTAPAAKQLMLAANCAGRAINITQTTAPHAMSYKLTGLYGLPHGHAVAVCLPEVWEYMFRHSESCVDGRGADHLRGAFTGIARALGCCSSEEAVGLLREMLAAMDILGPTSESREADLALLVRSVNPERLKNNPVALDSGALRALYERILRR